MHNIIIPIIIGFGIGIIDIVPMIIKKLDLMFILSAMTMWILVGFLIPKIDISDLFWVRGCLMAVIMFLPLSFLIFRLDRSALIQISITTLLLGALSGYLVSLFIK